MSNTDIKLIAGLDLDASPKQIVNDVKKIEQTLKSQGIKLSIDLDFDDGKLTKSCKDKLLYVSKILSDGIKIFPQFELDKNNLNQVESKIKEYYKNIDGINDKTIKVTSFKNAEKEITSFVTEINRGKGVVEKFKYALKDLGNGKVGFEYDGGSIVDKSSVDFKRATQQAAEYQSKLSELKSTYKSFMSGTSVDNSFKSLVDTLNFKGITDTTELDAMISKFKEAQAQAKSFNTEINKKWSSNAAEKLDQYLKQLPADLDYLESKFVGADIKVPDSITNLFAKMREQLVSISKINEPEGKIKLYNELSAELNEVTQRYKLLNQEQKNTKKSEELSLNKSKLSTNINTWINQNSTAANLFASQISDIKSRIQNADSTSLKNLQTEFSNVQAEAKQLGLTSDNVTQGIRTEFDRIVTSVVSLTAAFQTFKKMVNTARELDKELFNLQVATGNTRDKTKDLLDTYNSMAKDLGSTTIQISNAADAWLRQGKTLAETNTLIRDSVILSKIGMIDSADATTYITSALKGYKLEAEDALGVISKLSAVDIVSASDAGGLAEAMSRTAASADLAGVSMDKLLGIIATIKETSQDSDEIVGTSVRTMLARYGNIKIGKFVDDETGEALNDVEATLNKLGIVTRVAGQFRDFEGVLDDVGKQWESFNRIDQNAIAAAMFGTRQRDRGIILLENYANALKYTEISANSTTEALEKFEYYQESLDAHVNSLKASYEQLASVVVNSDFLSNATDAGAGFLDTLTFIIDKLGVLSTGIGTLTIGGALKGKTVGLFGNNGTDITFLGKTADEMRIATAEGERFGGIFAKNVVHPVQNASLIIDNYNRLVDTQCVSQANLNRITDDAGMLSYIQGLDGARASMTGYTASLQMSATATTGLKIATVALNMALNMGVMFAFTSSIKFATKMINGLINQTELAHKAAEAAAEENEELKSSIESINSELETTKSRMDELEKQGSLSFVEQEELQKLRDTTAELKRQLEVKTALQKVADEDARETAIDYLNTSGGQYRYGGWDMSQVENGNQRYGQAIDSLYTDNRVVATEQMISDYQELIKRQEELNSLKADFIKNNPQGYADEDAYRNIDMESVAIDSALSMLKENIPKAIEELDKFDDSLDLEKDESLISQINSIQDAFSGLFGGKATSVTDNFNSVWESDSFKQYRTELERMALSGEIDRSVLTSNENYRKLLDATGATAEEVAQNIESLVAEMEKAGQIDFGFGDTFSKSEMISAINELSEGFESLDKIMASINSEDPFDYSLLDDSKFKETFSELGDSYADFIDKISNSPKDINACQSAFDDLLTAWVNSTNILDGLSDETADLTINMLSNMGVANAEEVVTSALIEKHAQLAAEKYYNVTASAALEGATANETLRILEEADAAGISTQYLAQLELAKIAVNGVTIDTNSDIDQIINLANAAGSSASALYQLAAAKAAVGGSALVDPTSGSYDRFAALEGERVKHSLETGKFDYQFESIDSSKFKSAAYGGGTKTSKSSGSGKGSGGGSGSEKEPTTVDWIEILIDRTTEKIERLQNQINDAANWRTKNPLTDTAIDEMTTKLDAYQSMYDKYMEKANSIGLSDLYIHKIQNGALEIEDISDENISKMVSEYQSWYDKAKSVETQIDEVKTSVKELNISKLDNIINDFDSLCSLMDKLTSYNEKLIEVRKKSGEEIYEDNYTDLIAEQNGIYESLEEEYTRVEAQLNKLIKAGDIKKYSEEWYKYQETLVDIKSSMEDCTDAVLDFREAIVDLRFDELNKFADSISNTNAGLSTLLTILGDGDKLTDGMLTTTGLSALAIYAQQLNNAKQEAAEYAEAIKALTEMYDNGDLTQEQYTERLYEYQQAQWSAVEATHAARDAILQLKYEAIDQEIKAFQELVDIKKEELDAEQALYEYRKKVQDQTKNIVTLEKKIKELSLSDDRADKAMKLKLEEELAEAKQELDDYQREYSIEQQKKSLDEEAEAFEDAKNKELQEIRSSLDKQDAVIKNYLSKVTDNYEAVYKDLTEKGSAYNMTMTEELTSPWKDAESATSTFSSAVSDAISKINYDISTIDTSGLSNLINMLNSFQGGSLDLGGGDFEDVTGEGKWHKNTTGDWYGNNDDDYVSDGYYNIKGQTYGFNEDGYMIKGWDDSQGDWYYFEPENGQMVKSSWRKSKKGDWYYLQSDGTMATSASIKAQNEEGYYLVDDDGMWDGKLVKKPDFAQYPLAYARGTKNVPRNTPAWINEIGEEVVMRPTDDSMLVSLKAHDKVLKADWSDNLFDFASNPSRFISDHIENIGVNAHYPEIVKTSESSGADVSIGSLITVEGNMTKSTFEEIKPELNKYMMHELPKQIRSVNKRY